MLHITYIIIVDISHRQSVTRKASMQHALGYIELVSEMFC